mmetsp:Transcript_75707/g.245291  ORF Transcript_75707/g.245291 Transcript_75707/m.245291 type:complete len:99 (+) Transcript_75707:777-1073(+)
MRGGIAIHRKSPEGLLTLRGCTLRRRHPSMAGGSEVVASAWTREEWFALLQQHFSLNLEDELTTVEQELLWDRVLHDSMAFLTRMSAPVVAAASSRAS